MTLNFFLGVIIFLVLCYQVFVTMKIRSDSFYSDEQKKYQIILIWAVPLFGSVISHLISKNNSEPLTQNDHKFIRNENEERYWD